MKNEDVEVYIFRQSNKQVIASHFQLEDFEGRGESGEIRPSLHKMTPSRRWLVSFLGTAGPNGKSDENHADHGKGPLVDALFDDIFTWYENGTTCPPKTMFQFPSIVSDQELSYDAEKPHESFTVELWRIVHVIGMLPQAHADIQSITALFHFAFDLRPLNLFHTVKELYLASLAVHPSHRGQGIGRTAMRLVENLAYRLGCHQIRLHVPTVIVDGMQTESFYEKMQFVRKRVVYRYYRGKHHAAEMVKCLNS